MNRPCGAGWQPAVSPTGSGQRLRITNPRYGIARHGGNQSSADFQVCCVADFQIRKPSKRHGAADLEVGDTAGLETCATRNT